MREFFNKPDLGQLLLRLCIGLYMFGNGVKTFMAGEHAWTFMGKRMSLIGITAYPMFWGVVAASIFTVGGLLIALGAFFRYAAFALFFTMVIAILYHISAGDEFFKATGFSFCLASVFLSMLFTGPGNIALQKS